MIAIETDVRERSWIDQLFQQMLSAFGRVDAVIANAATFNPFTASIDIDMADWHRVIVVNLTGAFETLQAGARILIEQGEGGWQLVMRALAVEVAPQNIRCNTIMPGLTRTPALDT